jgi:hypothetical protein
VGITAEVGIDMLGAVERFFGVDDPFLGGVIKETISTGMAKILYLYYRTRILVVIMDKLK